MNTVVYLYMYTGSYQYRDGWWAIYLHPTNPPQYHIVVYVTVKMTTGEVEAPCGSHAVNGVFPQSHHHTLVKEVS